MDKSYSIKQGVAVAALCLLTDFSFAQVNCQNGVDYKNSCNPYEVKLLKAYTTLNSDKKIAYKVDSSSRHKDMIIRSYFNRLLDRYSSKYNGDFGFQSLIDRSSYKAISLKNIDEEKNKTISKVIKEDSLASSNSFKKTTDKETSNQIDSKLATNTTLKKSTQVNVNISKHTKLTKFKTYKVKAGDNVSKIAEKFNVKRSVIIALNKLDNNATIKLNQKLKLPLTAKIKKAKKIVIANSSKSKIIKNKKFYIVKKGDTLLSIAKRSNISITKLREINRLSRSSILKVGTKIYFKHTKLAKAKKNSLNYLKSLKFKKTASLRYKKKLRVTATAYTSHKAQTDSTPFLAAWNNRLRPGMKIIAVSHDLIKHYGLKNGVKVKIMGLRGYYVVRDKMNKRFRKRIDIYMGMNKRRALKWGRRKITLYW